MMKLKGVKSKLKTFYTFFIAPPKQWKKPKISEILIYDTVNSKYLATYLTNYSVEIIALRGESINITCLLRAIFTLCFWKGKRKQAYVDVFIRSVVPRIIITFIDNDIDFYTISNRFPNIKTIFFQNGSRSEVGDIFENLVPSDKYYVDYMLVHGSAIGKYYQKFISGLTIEIGSLKSNEVTKSMNVEPQSIVFVSQYFDKPKNNKALFIISELQSIYWEQFFSAEVQALKFLDKWCIENDKQLLICGRGINDTSNEKKFYTEYLTMCKWKYVPRSDFYSSYRLIDSAEIVVFIDSTLGYESIGRGNKTASFSCRMASLNSEGAKFGWPAKLPKNGPFWTSEADENQFQSVMDYLNTVSDIDWEKTRQNYVCEIMEFDAGNTRFITLLDQLLTKPRNLKYA